MNMNVDSRHMIHFWCHWRIKIYLELTIPSAVIQMHFKMWELFADNQFLLHILTLCDTKCYRNKLNYLLPSCCHTCILMKQNLELFLTALFCCCNILGIYWTLHCFHSIFLLIVPSLMKAVTSSVYFCLLYLRWPTCGDPWNFTALKGEPTLLLISKNIQIFNGYV